MNKIKLWKRYGDGSVRCIDINDHEDSVKYMLSQGFYLSESEATAGQVKPAAAPKAPTKQAPKKAAPKKRHQKKQHLKN